jgi:hypothetical protein
MIGSQESKENKGRVDEPIEYVVRSAVRKNRRLKRPLCGRVKGKCEKGSSYHQIRKYRHITDNIKIANVILPFLENK